MFGEFFWEKKRKFSQIYTKKNIYLLVKKLETIVGKEISNLILILCSFSNSHDLSSL
jgi:hypothetical protein